MTRPKTATKISFVECLLGRSGRDDKGRNPMNHYQEAILFLEQERRREQVTGRSVREVGWKRQRIMCGKEAYRT